MEKNNKHIDFNYLTRFLASELNSEEQELVKGWVDASVKNRMEFEDLQKAWDSTGKTAGGQIINIEKEWEYHQRKMYPSAQTGKKFFLKSFIRLAAAIILGVGIALAGIKYNAQYSVRTKLTETTEIELPDGSKVTLNAGSKLSYLKKNFGEENRTIKLQGEAYFVVEKDKDRPFIIQLEEAEIKVLGTSFNVKAYKKMDAVEVTVSEGKVSVYDKEVAQKQVIATKGEKAEFDKELKIVKKYANADLNYQSWKTRSVVFQNDSLGLIARTLEDVYHKKIVLTTPGLNSCTLTTSFENEDLTTVLKVLESTLDLEIKEEKKVIYIAGEGCGIE